MKRILKSVILLILLSILLLITWHTVRAADLLLKYPPIAEEELTSETTLPAVIKYIYLFALGAAGIIALLFMLIGAIRYIFSAGNPSKAGDAKDQIFSAILGIILLLASVLILRTINPDLVTIGFKLPEIKVQDGGTGATGNYACYCCCYTLKKCDPLSKPEYRRWCSTNLTQADAQNQCYSECAYSHCPWKIWQGYQAKLVREPCNK